MLLPSSRAGAIDAHRLITNKAEPVPLAAAIGGGDVTASCAVLVLSTSSSPCPNANQPSRALAARRDSFRWGRERASMRFALVTVGFAIMFLSVLSAEQDRWRTRCRDRISAPWQPRCLRK